MEESDSAGPAVAERESRQSRSTKSPGTGILGDAPLQGGMCRSSVSSPYAVPGLASPQWPDQLPRGATAYEVSTEAVERWLTLDGADSASGPQIYGC